MEKQNSKKMGLINGIVLLVITLGALYLANDTQSSVAMASVVLLGIGTLISIFSFVQGHLISREQDEELEMQALDQTRGNESLFAGAAEDAYPARNARRQFEKWVVPAFSFLILIFQSVGLIWIYNLLSDTATTPLAVVSALTIMFNGLFIIILFLMGKYSAGLARMNDQELLRPGASYMLLGSVVSTSVVISQTATYFGYPGWDRAVTWGVFAIITISAVENLVTLILEIYRPRIDGKKARLLYDSRLIGLLGQPGSLISTATQALDYQFGFKVSETWFYRYVEQKLALIISIQFIVLFFSSSFVVINANEKATLERFGNLEDVLDPGFHLKLPWPVDKIYRFKTDEVHSFTLGVVDDNYEKDEEEKKKTRVLLWTQHHNHGSAETPDKNMNMIVASDVEIAGTSSETPSVNLLTVSIPIQYRINNLTNWIEQTENPGKLMQSLAMREVTQFLIGADIDNLMGPGYTDAQNALKEEIQSQVVAHNLGAEILFVGLQHIHPPVGQNEQSKQSGGVAENYEKVIVAQLNAETNRLGALYYSAGKVPQAQASAAELLAKAKIESTNKVAIAQAEAKRFANQVKAFEGAPSVYKTRMKLETFQAATKGSRKYILSDPANRDVINLELQDQLRSDLLDVTVDSDK